VLTRSGLDSRRFNSLRVERAQKFTAQPGEEFYVAVENVRTCWDRRNKCQISYSMIKRLKKGLKYKIISLFEFSEVLS
jgi:hypothetical protein